MTGPTDYEALRARHEARVAAQAAPVVMNYQAAIDGAKADAAARASRTRTDDGPYFSPQLHAAAIRHEKRIGRLGDRNEAGARARNRYEKISRAIGTKGETVSNITNLPTTVPAADPHALMEAVILHGDLSKLSSKQRTDFYMSTCNSLGLNPLTRPFDYIRLNGKEVLYAKRDCADQLRAIRRISLEVISETVSDGMITVRVRATAPDGRSDSDIGAVPVVYPDSYRDRDGSWKRHPKAGQKMTGEDLANALMKATTKAKRRVTLSLCGLGFLDETEVAAVLEAEAQLAHAAPAKAIEAPKKPPATFKLEGLDQEFPSTGRGWLAALEAIDQGDTARLVLLNMAFLDRACERFPDVVADIRGKAAELLAPHGGAAEPDGQDVDPAFPDAAAAIPATEPDMSDFDPETGEVTEADDVSRRMAERRGAAPPDDGSTLPA
jgi:hypothetical protein